MKYISKITLALIFSITLLGCNETEQVEELKLVDNTENINKIINTIDLTFKTSVKNKSLNESQLGNIFIEESRKQGLNIVEINNSLAKSENNEFKFSNKYIEYSKTILSVETLNEKEYKSQLANLELDVRSSNISILEKQLLIDNIGFMNAFVDWMGGLNNLKSKSSNLMLKSGCDGWWSCWGKCVAGTIGGTLTGFVEGCGIGAAIGATVGAIGATPISVGAGALTGCAIGGTIGAVGGGLSGAAESC
jgi:hypothetical protein